LPAEVHLILGATELQLRPINLTTLRIFYDTILKLLTQYRPAIPNIETKQLILILKNPYNSRST